MSFTYIREPTDWRRHNGITSAERQNNNPPVAAQSATANSTPQTFSAASLGPTANNYALQIDQMSPRPQQERVGSGALSPETALPAQTAPSVANNAQSDVLTNSNYSTNRSTVATPSRSSLGDSSPMVHAGHGEQTVILPTGQTNSSQAIATALNDCGNYLLDRINNSATFYPPGFAAELANIIGHPVKLPNILAPRDWVAGLVNQFESYLASADLTGGTPQMLFAVIDRQLNLSAHESLNLARRLANDVVAQFNTADAATRASAFNNMWANIDQHLPDYLGETWDAESYEDTLLDLNEDMMTSEGSKFYKSDGS